MNYVITVLCCLLSLVVSAQGISEEILQQNRNMEAAYNSGAVTSIADYYTKKATIVGPRTEVKGNDAIIAYWKGLEGKHVNWKLENLSITEYGNVAVQQGVSHLTHMYQGKEHTSVVRFTLVWVQEDGQWKINVDHYSPKKS